MASNVGGLRTSAVELVVKAGDVFVKDGGLISEKLSGGACKARMVAD